MSVMLYPCILCVALLMDLFFLCVVCLGVVAILLFNVMEMFSVGQGALLDRPLWSSKDCVWCACYTSVHPSVPSI